MREPIKIVYVHIGLERTATTWLQNMIFNSHPEINYLGKTSENYPKWLIEWQYLDDYTFNKSVSRIKERIRESVEKSKNREPDPAETQDLLEEFSDFLTPPKIVAERQNPTNNTPGGILPV